jgi:hypothetical protein
MKTSTIISIGATIGIACTGYIASEAMAATHHHHHHHRHHSSLQIRDRRVLGFHVRSVSYKPGSGYRMTVGASRHSVHTVPHWANAGHRQTKTMAAINGNPWVWRTLRPVGTVRTHGHWISRPSRAPAVGFLANGKMIFGSRPAKHAGAMNIIPGKAYLMRGGKIQRHYPWAAPAQRNCNTAHTDGGYGCWRPVEARWKNGRVGLVMVAFANMSQAAHVLKRMGVADAMTGDSGGSTNLWTRHGSGGCSRLSNGHVYGHCFGALHHAGLPYERAIPNVAMIVKNR